MSEEILKAITDIYAAPGTTIGWNSAVESITKLVGGKAGVYMLVNGENLHNEINSYYGYLEHDRAQYEGSNGAATDIRFQYIHNMTPGKVFREFEYVTDREAYEQSQWIKYLENNYGIYWGLAAHVSTHGLWRDMISIGRLKELGPHTDDEKNALQRLIPHISRAAELHKTLSSLETQYGAILSVLDKLLIGVVLLDKSSNVAASNLTARRITSETGIVKITRNGKFIASNDTQNTLMQTMIHRTLSTALSHGDDTGGQLPLAKNNTQILADIMPLRDDKLSDSACIQGTAIFLVDIAVAQFLDMRGISKIFSLSNAEKYVAESLVNGFSLNEIADSRNASIETIRKQLKTVYAKTGVRSQLELLRLASLANPPIEKP